MKRLILLAVLLWPVGAVADLAAGLEAAKRGDFATAMREWRPLAEQNNAKAQFNLGLMYAQGDGVPEDDAEAVRWYRLAAEQGYASAQLNLGLMYGKGEGVPEDKAKAVKWYRLAAKQGKARAQYNLGVMYAKGEGVPEDDVRAYAWWNLSAAQGYKDAAEYKKRKRKEMTSAQIAKAQNLSNTLAQRIRRGESTEEPGPPMSAYPQTQHSSGSGFFVSSEGYLVTNRHVINGCGKVTVMASGTHFNVDVLSVDKSNDLALLKVGGGQREPAALRSARRAALGERVTVAGFPLSGLLSDDLNVTSGSISALAGIGNNPRVIQITAPVQPGNSGGPLLDKSGHVIGVVVSKLNATKVYKLTGDLPQNINFAVKGALLRSFLDIHGVDYPAGDTKVALSGEDVAAKARQFVVSVRCWK
jgi:TPR repeat protein